MFSAINRSHSGNILPVVYYHPYYTTTFSLWYITTRTTPQHSPCGILPPLLHHNILPVVYYHPYYTTTFSLWYIITPTTPQHSPCGILPPVLHHNILPVVYYHPYYTTTFSLWYITTRTTPQHSPCGILPPVLHHNILPVVYYHPYYTTTFRTRFLLILNSNCSTLVVYGKYAHNVQVFNNLFKTLSFLHGNYCVVRIMHAYGFLSIHGETDNIGIFF